MVENYVRPSDRADAHVIRTVLSETLNDVPSLKEWLALGAGECRTFALSHVEHRSYARLARLGEEGMDAIESQTDLDHVYTAVFRFDGGYLGLFSYDPPTEKALHGLSVPCEAVGINVLSEDDGVLLTPAGSGSTWTRVQIPTDAEVAAMKNREGAAMIAEFRAHWKARRTWTRHHTKVELEGYRAEIEGERASSIPLDGKWIVDVPFAQGTLAMNRAGSEPFTTDDITLLERFTEVFALGYRRYLDLSAAEKRAALSAREAGYERVRSAVLAARNTDDILTAASLMERELRQLGVRFAACGINLIDEEAGEFHTLVASREGATYQPVSTFDEPIISEVVSHWRRSATYMRAA